MSNEKVNLKDIQNKIVTRGRRGSGKKKLTPSLYDTPLENRTYWGNDPGSEIAIANARLKISSSIRKGYLFDLDEDKNIRRLNKEYLDELYVFQMELLKHLEIECGHEIIITSGSDNRWYLQFIL